MSRENFSKIVVVVLALCLLESGCSTPGVAARSKPTRWDKAQIESRIRGWAKLKDIQLTDYKVRILTGGTDAVTRVLIESRDGEGNRWFTVGVSPNIVDASFEALTDAICYKLLKNGVSA